MCNSIRSWAKDLLHHLLHGRRENELPDKFEPRENAGKQSMTGVLRKFTADEQGATAIEYGLIAAIIGVGGIASLQSLKNSLNSMFGQVNANIAN